VVDTISSGAVKYLSGFSDITSLLGSFTDAGPNFGLPFLFQEDLLVSLEGSSSMAIVCSDEGGWGAMAGPLTTPQYMRLSVELYADPLRDSSFNILESKGSVHQRTATLWATINTHLHRTNPDSVLWGDLRTTSCELLTRPTPQPVPDGDLMQVWQSYYGVTVLGATGSTVV
jgi:hypothetical protein